MFEFGQSAKEVLLCGRPARSRNDSHATSLACPGPIIIVDSSDRGEAPAPLSCADPLDATLRWWMQRSSVLVDVPSCKGSRAGSSQAKPRVFGGVFGFRSHRRHTPLRLQCDLTFPPTGPAPSNAHQGRTPGRCDRPDHRPISIGIEPEGITPHCNVKPGAASRGIPAAKETCSATN